ncbi:hypothetical protein AAHE18_04G166500 [Arachis hypogaea]
MLYKISPTHSTDKCTKNERVFTPLNLLDAALLLFKLSSSACRFILLIIFFQLVNNRSSSQRVSVSIASISSSISSSSCFRFPFLFLMICITCSIFSRGKLCNPIPNLCFSSRLISLLLGSFASGPLPYWGPSPYKQL